MKDKKLVILDKQQIKQTIQSGDTCTGMWYLAVSLEGIPEIYFAENNRQWNPWNENDHVISIPPLYCKGRGGEYEAAKEVVEDTLGLDFSIIKASCAKQEIDLYDYVYEKYPQYLKDHEEASINYYLTMFIDVCNGLDGAMDDELTWGYTVDEDDYLDWIQPPFTFEWGS